MLTLMDSDVTPVKLWEGSAAWGRAFARLYDPFVWVGERAGVRPHRQELLSRAGGCTLEIGSGTGLNLAHYPDDVDDLVLVEPDAAMRSRLEKRLSRSGRRARLVDAPAERLPFADGSFDTVVSTLVLCTVDAPDVALREIARVLRPDGQVLFLEHVRSESPTLAWWQDRLAGPWRHFARGCRCNRATAQLITACGFELQALRTASWQAMPPIVRPLIVGRAQKTGVLQEENGSVVANRPRPATTEVGSSIPSVRIGLVPPVLEFPAVDRLQRQA
jgi:SAM-dependent methyltransferase